MEKKLSTFDKCRSIRSSLLRRVGEALSYESWSDKFRMQNIRDVHSNIKNWELSDNESFKIDPNDLSESEMIDLGFGKWDKDSKLMLIPIWLFPFLKDEFECGGLSSESTSVKKLSEMDNDHRFGVLGYGVVPREKK